jgi:hypothetical protein
VVGFGIYRPNTEGVSIVGRAKFCVGSNSSNQPVYIKEINLKREVENKVFRCMFDKPILIKAGEQSSCVCEFTTGNSYYGTDGRNIVNGEGDVVFNFAESSGSSNGTSLSSG